MSTAAIVATPATRLLLAAGLPAGAALLCLALLPAQPQPLAYHEFADARTLLGIPNFLNVATNLPFLLVGCLGIVFLLADGRSRRTFHHPAERWPYLLFFAGVALTSAGSAFYHLAPDNPRLAFDRLPMTLAFMPLLAATIVDRVDARTRLRLLVPLTVMGFASVAWWRVSAWLGVEDLRHYLAVQFGSIATVLLLAALLPSRYPRGGYIYAVFALYALARAAEIADGWLFGLGAVLSGHSLKHLLAALGALLVLHMLVLRAGQAPERQR